MRDWSYKRFQPLYWPYAALRLCRWALATSSIGALSWPSISLPCRPCRRHRAPSLESFFQSRKLSSLQQFDFPARHTSVMDLQGVLWASDLAMATMETLSIPASCRVEPWPLCCQRDMLCCPGAVQLRVPPACSRATCCAGGSLSSCCPRSRVVINR